MRHLTKCLVVTSPDDERTREIATSVPGVKVFETDAFTRHGARFNKGLAMEEGFRAMGREGWIWIFDADILFPDSIPLHLLKPGKLHGARRRILKDPTKWTPDLNWRECELSRDGGPIGFTQIFHADDPAIKDRPQWYDVSFTHAGGGDAYMLTHWPKNNRVVLPMEVLHLGPTDLNWFGTSAEGRDMMAKFVTENGWHRAMKNFTHDAVARSGEIAQRVSVPGYEPTGYELPFVRRHQARQGDQHPPGLP
jgi:hypothetical protein